MTTTPTPTTDGALLRLKLTNLVDDVTDRLRTYAHGDLALLEKLLDRLADLSRDPNPAPSTSDSREVHP